MNWPPLPLPGDEVLSWDTVTDQRWIADFASYYGYTVAGFSLAQERLKVLKQIAAEAVQ